jgi:hypothetical protein
MTNGRSTPGRAYTGQGDQDRVARRLGSRLRVDARSLGDGALPELAVDAAAVYRIVRLLQQDDITQRPREEFVKRYGAGFWGPLADCPWCLSVWVGIGAAVARSAAPRLWGIVARGLAFSAAAGVITGAVERLESDRRE